MKANKKLIAAAVLGLGLTGVAYASALTFSFQPCGNATCTITGAGLLDWAPGNTLAESGAGGGALLPVGAKVTDLFQANLGTVQDPLTNNLYANGGGGHYFTVVASFGEKVSSTFLGPIGPVALGSKWFGGNTFEFDPTSTANNFFYVYENDVAIGNNLTGAGFTAGKIILSGKIVSVFSQENVDPNFFTTDLSGLPSIKPCGRLDQSPNGNQLGPVDTICVGGSSDVTTHVEYADKDYFPDLPVDLSFVLGLTNTSLISPYKQIDPSLNFTNDGIASGNTPNNIGAINGISGPNYVFQSDANTSFVPEPGSLALIGASLLGVFGIGRRKERA